MNKINSKIRVCLLPGLICSDYVWSAQVSALADYDVVAVQGYGKAESITAMAERVLSQVSGKFALAGHSMGARVALEMLRLVPERVERIALLDTGVHPRRPDEREKRMALVEIGRRQGMKALVNEWLPPMVHPARRDDDTFMAPLKDMAVGAGLEQFERQIGALLTRPDARQMLSSIVVPTLIGVGNEDEWSPPEQHQAFASRIPGARLIVFENAGHMAPLEAPRQVNSALLTWLGAS